MTKRGTGMLCLLMTAVVMIQVSAGDPERSGGSSSTTTPGLPAEGAQRWDYHTYDEMTDLLQELQSLNADIMSVSSIGKTWEGRDLWAVKISDNVAIDEDEPDVLLMGAHHGNEKPSYEVLIYFIQHLVEAYRNESADGTGGGAANEDPLDGRDYATYGVADEESLGEMVREAVNSTQIYLIPMVNPDGVEVGDRKNSAPNFGPFGNGPFVTSHGVDLNRNYDYQWDAWFKTPWKYWSSTNQFQTRRSTYRGESPFCENETRAIREFVNQHDFVISVSYHTYGEYILYPWGYTEEPSPDNDVFMPVADNISKINNYTTIQGSLWYPTLGDSDDWLYGVHGVIAYTIELGTSYAPTESDVVAAMCETHVEVNLYVCEIAHTL